MKIKNGDCFIRIKNGDSEIYKVVKNLKQYSKITKMSQNKKLFVNRNTFLKDCKVILFDGRDTMDFIKIYQKAELKNLDILPCPKCKSENVCVTEYDHPAGKRYGVLCTECLCSQYTGWMQTISGAVEEWNKRKT